MNSISYIQARDAHTIIDYVRSQNPLAARDASLVQQVEAMEKRRHALIAIWDASPLIQRRFPDGFWEEDRELWCFCEATPSGHELESVTFKDPSGYRPDVGCLFRDGELFDKLCPSCRKPCEAYSSRQVGGERDETWQEAHTKCCGESPVRPNGAHVTASECESEENDEYSN